MRSPGEDPRTAAGTDPRAGAGPAPRPEAAHPPPDLLAQAFTAAPNGFLVLDADGVIVAANAAVAAMVGHPPDSLAGQPVQALLPHGLPAPGGSDADQPLDARHRDGHVFPVAVGLTPLPALPGSGGGALALASVVDLSDRLPLEWAFRGLFDGSPYGKLIVDDDGRIVMANPVLARTLGYTPAALAGRPLAMLLPERYRAGHAAMMAGYQRSGGQRTMGEGRDLTALHADGHELPVEIALSRVRWQHRTMTLAAISDISTRKRLEQELRQANANLEEFTYVASHDLRSPLRGIADLVEWITDDLGADPPPAVRRNLDRIGQRIRRMERLTGDLLSYARAGRAASEVASVDLEAMLRGILDLQPLPAGLQVDLAVTVPPFQATAVPLETALRNLVANAVKHHDRSAEGHVRVAAAAEDGWCTIEVADDGPGVPAAAQARVFQLFQTASAADRAGTGIGLALTKRLVEVHGGQITLVSPWPPAAGTTRGACFRIRWPRFPRRAEHDR